MMNARARQLGLTHTHYSTPIGLDTPGQLLERLGSRQARRATTSRTQPFFARIGGAAARRAPHRRPGPRSSSTATTSSAACRGSTASRPATPSSAGYVLVGSATRDGMTLLSAVLGTAQRGGARREHARAARLRLRELPLADAGPARRGPGPADGQGPARAAGAAWSPRATFTRVVAARQPRADPRACPARS